MDKVKRNTKQKKEVIEFLKINSNKHLNIQEIKEGVTNEIGLTTIYRVINSLIKAGEILKKPLENSQGFCYQYNSKNDTCKKNNHYHLICEICNKLFHYENDNISKIYVDIEKELNFKVNNQRIAFYGICDDCNKKIIGGNI